MKIPRELIYEDKLSLDDFEIDTDGSLDCAFYDMLQKVEKLPLHFGGDLEKTYLDMFNDAYYIATRVLIDKRPELKFDEYKEIAGEEIISSNVSIYSEDSVRGICVLSMVHALLNDLDYMDKSVQRFSDKLRTWINEKDDCQWMGNILSCDPFSKRMAPNLAPREIKPSILIGVKWSDVITLFNKQGDFQKSQVDSLVNALGKTVNEKVYIIDALKKYIDNMEANELPF